MRPERTGKSSVFKWLCWKIPVRLCLLLVLYLLSIGPMLAFCRKPVLPAFGIVHCPHPQNVWIDRIYAPLYDFREPFVCMPEFADASPAKQQVILAIRHYVYYWQELKYSLK